MATVDPIKSRFWTPRRVGAAYLALLVLSIPWYLPDGFGQQLIGGFPLWCLISLACYAAAAALTVGTIDRVWVAEPQHLRGGSRFGEPPP